MNPVQNCSCAVAPVIAAPEPANLTLVFFAGRVRRWHQNPHMSGVDDPNDGHQGRVARILLALHPRPSVMLLAAALTHDDGELRAGDMGGAAKRKNPVLRKMVRQVEREGQREIWGAIASDALTLEETEWLKFADSLDSYAMMRLYRPNLRFRNDWQRQRECLESFARRHEMFDNVRELLDIRVDYEMLDQG